MWRRCLDACRGDVVGFVEGWFYDEALESLNKADVECWIAGNVFGKAPDALGDRKARQLSWMVDLLEARLAADLEVDAFRFPDDGPTAKPYMSAPSQEIERRLHPLLLYAFLGAARRAYGLQLNAAGFTKKRAGRLSYWHRPGRDVKDGFAPTPVVFAHGIGVGLLPYKDVIAKLGDGAHDDGAATYLLELPAISTTLKGEELPRPLDLAYDAAAALRANGDASAVWVGHSFGSAAMSYVSRRAGNFRPRRQRPT